MRCDVEADLTLLRVCNFRCDYCFSMPGAEAPAIAPERWQRAFDAGGLTWLVNLTGGEPALYPAFVELCERLTRRHALSLNTNLTPGAVADFARRIDPGRVRVVHAAFHPDERRRRGGLGAFFRHAGLLRGRGFRLMVSVVATPEILGRFDEVARLLAPHGLVAAPKLLRGSYLGRVYPDSYSEADRRNFREAAALARAAYAPMLSAMDEPPTIDPLDDDRHLEREPDYRGRPCAIGRRFFRIAPDGEIHDCVRTRLGNLLDGPPAFGGDPVTCAGRFCHYFCRKYAS